MDDFSLIVCKKCGESKKRIRAGKFGNGKDTRWTDEAGRQFNGLCCPECWAKSVADKKRYKSEENKRIKQALAQANPNTGSTLESFLKEGSNE